MVSFSLRVRLGALAAVALLSGLTPNALPGYRHRLPNAGGRNPTTQRAPRPPILGERPNDPTTRVLLVGGGPFKPLNQASIEDNVRYVQSLLPKGGARIVLFADGRRDSQTVFYRKPIPDEPPADRILALLQEEPPVTEEIPEELRGSPALDFIGGHLRAPQLPQIDGSTRPDSVRETFMRLQKEASDAPILMYWTGHGQFGRPADTFDVDFNRNAFSLWYNESFSVQQLAEQLAKLPAKTPVTLIMVQCYGGAFANLLFEDGDPRKNLTERDFIGFFASVAERKAAGCTAEANASEAREFTSYFFAALFGKDRRGRSVTGADYDGDGQVGMHEAFYYAVSHDESIDTPVCTSEVFLRRFVPAEDREVFESLTYADARKQASPAQRAALDGLRAALGYSERSAVAVAWAEFEAAADYDNGVDPYGSRIYFPKDGLKIGSYAEPPPADPAAYAAYFHALAVARATLWTKFPGLRNFDRRNKAYDADYGLAHAWLEKQGGDAPWKTLLDACAVKQRAEAKDSESRIRHARRIRFVRLLKTIALTRRLRDGKDEAAKKRFERIVALEARPLAGAAGKKE